MISVFPLQKKELRSPQHNSGRAKRSRPTTRASVGWIFLTRRIT